MLVALLDLGYLGSDHWVCLEFHGCHVVDCQGWVKFAPKTLFGQYLLLLFLLVAQVGHELWVLGEFFFGVLGYFLEDADLHHVGF